jgi:hypothetical protein
MDFKLNGKVKQVFDTQTWDSGFSKREFVVTTQEQYPQDIKFELLKDKTSLLDTYKPGDDIEVSFNVRGSEYNGKYFVNLQAWRLQKSSSPAGASAPPPMPEAPNTVLETTDSEDDDLPF